VIVVPPPRVPSCVQRRSLFQLFFFFFSLTSFYLFYFTVNSVYTLGLSPTKKKTKRRGGDELCN
jgi:hypothetical protein